MVSSTTTVEALIPFPMVLGTLALSLIGFFGNGMVILATITSPRLRNRCNILICILAIADFVTCIYFIQLRVFMLLKWYFLQNAVCYLYSIYGLFSINIQTGMELVLSADRLLAVIAPIRYSGLPLLLYVMMMTGVFVYAVLLTLYGYLNTTGELVPVCLPPTAYSNRAKLVWIGINFVISLVVTSVYGVAHVKCRNIKAITTQKHSIERIRHLLNSLSVIMIIYTTTWLITVTVLLIMEIFHFNPQLRERINQQLGWLVIINTSMNFFVYFWRTPDYRNAFICLLRLKNNDRVVSVTSQPQGHKTSAAAVLGNKLFLQQ